MQGFILYHVEHIFRRKKERSRFTIDTIHLGSFSGLKPTVNFASYTEEQASTQWGPRRIPDCQFFYVVSGQAELLLGNHKYVLHEKNCAFYGPHNPHRLTLLRETVYYSVHFHWQHEHVEPVHPAHRITTCSEDSLSEAATAYRIQVPGYDALTIPHQFSIPSIEPLLMKISKEYQMEEPGYALVMRAYLTELFTMVVRGLIRNEGTSSRDKIGPALAAMRDHPETDWTVQELAALCGYHPNYFSSVFKEMMGTTPKHYLIAERIRKAKSMLLGKGNIESIAQRLGYSSIHYFSRNFKEITGLTPSQFKQQGVSR